MIWMKILLTHPSIPLNILMLAMMPVGPSGLQSGQNSALFPLPHQIGNNDLWSDRRSFKQSIYSMYLFDPVHRFKITYQSWQMYQFASMVSKIRCVTFCGYYSSRPSAFKFPYFNKRLSFCQNDRLDLWCSCCYVDNIPYYGMFKKKSCTFSTTLWGILLCVGYVIIINFVTPFNVC